MTDLRVTALNLQVLRKVQVDLRVTALNTQVARKDSESGLRVTQAVADVIVSQTTSARVTAAHIEVLRLGVQPTQRVTAMHLEVLRQLPITSPGGGSGARPSLILIGS